MEFMNHKGNLHFFFFVIVEAQSRFLLKSCEAPVTWFKLCGEIGGTEERTQFREHTHQLRAAEQLRRRMLRMQPQRPH